VILRELKSDEGEKRSDYEIAAKNKKAFIYPLMNI